MIVFLMLYFGMKMFFMHKKHLLMLLLTLEFISLIVLIMLINFFSMYVLDFSLVVYFLIIIVCEAVLGLLLMTMIVRVHGSDYVKSLVLLC
uniref:NADH-ubiquinone oxidoreductase chain 4L n=1 Tax=Pachypsylla venusta TaxID=38123 RepID=Q69HC8_PACVE|nr:NADH dehydrogenase subunit 4L [Pachypsylla venusta]